MSDTEEIIGKQRGFSDFVVYVDESGDCTTTVIAYQKA